VQWYPRQTDYGTSSYERRLYRDIVRPNMERAAPLVRSARRRWRDSPVIDPTGLEDVPGWEQRDYHEFWTRLIEDSVATVVFAEGWQYSSGCALEFAAALRTGCKLLDHKFKDLTPDRGLEMIAVAAQRLRTVGVGDALLQKAIADSDNSRRLTYKD
jgi:hypothetical protein